jgi:transcriptional regulator with XRE-family HTH domain
MLNNIDIGSRIATLRKLRGYTQENLVEVIGEDRLSLSTLKRLEQGKGHLDLINLFGISNALNVSITELISEEDMRTDVRAFYNDPDEQYSVEDIIERQALYYPKVPGGVYYSNQKITNLLQFIIYLPLMDPGVLFECLHRIAGDAFNRDSYVQDKLRILYSSIPESDAKMYADMMVEKCTSEYFMKYHTTGISEIDEQSLDKDKLPEFIRLWSEYMKVIERKQTTIAEISEIQSD